MHILITGTADKRPIVYPLLYTLNFLGRTILLTDDTSFRRLLPGCRESGDLGNIHIDTVSLSSASSEEFCKKIAEEFEHRVIVTFGTPTVAAHTLHVIRDEEEPTAPAYIRVGYAQPKARESFISLTESLLKQIDQIERTSRLAPPKDAKTLKVLAQTFAPIFDKSPKEMKKLLTYKGGKIT